MLAGDTEDRRVYKLDVKGQGVFGTSTATAKSLNDYIKMLESRGVDAGQVVTRITFDTDASVPKLLFKPSRYIDEFELAAVKDLVGSDEVEGLATVNMNTVDLSGEDSDLAPATEQEAPQEQEAAPATTAKAQPAQAAQRPVQAQKPAPQAAQRPAAQAAQKPQPAKQQTPIVVETIPTAKAAPAVQEVDSSADLESILEGLDL
jgi:outer membrane biosynthesis protein TonB